METMQPIQFTLVVHYFGIKYVNKKDAELLVNALKDYYNIEIVWKGALNCGITLGWN